MTVYIILWAIVIIACFIETNFKYLKFGRFKIIAKNPCFFTIYIYSLLIGIMRNELHGVDSISYQGLYYYKGNSPIISIMLDFVSDNGYYFLGKIVHDIGVDFWGFRAILYIITFSIFAHVIYKESKNVSISFLCYFGIGFLVLDFCILRQAAACSICFYAFRYLKEKEKVKFVFLVLLAATFHKTAIFYLVLLALTSDKVKKLSIVKKIVLVLGAVLVGQFILPLMYQFYSNDYSNLSIKGEGEMLLIAYAFLILAMGYYYKKNKDSSMQIEYDTLFTSIYAQIIALFFSLFTRVTNYFAMMFTLVIPDFVMKRKDRNVYLLIIIFVFSILYYLGIQGADMVPYMTQ